MTEHEQPEYKSSFPDIKKTRSSQDVANEMQHLINEGAFLNPMSADFNSDNLDKLAEGIIQVCQMIEHTHTIYHHRLERLEEQIKEMKK